MILFGRSGEKCGRISLIRLALSGYPMFTKCFERVRSAVLITASYTVIRRHVQPEENFLSIRVAHMLLIYHFNFISESKLKKRKTLKLKQVIHGQSNEVSWQKNPQNKQNRKPKKQRFHTVLRNELWFQSIIAAV